MVKHNNVIPNVHLRKHWQTNVRVWLNQAARKKKRLSKRRQLSQRLAPRPLDKLRPIVNCTTIRYNHRSRLGRGFTLAEIKAAGLGISFARSIGIYVDHRRKNRSQESLQRNKSRLLKYINSLVLFPRHQKKYITKAKIGIINDTPKDNQKIGDKPIANTLPPLIKRVKSIGSALLDTYKKNQVYKVVRQQWNNQRNQGKRKRKAQDDKAGKNKAKQENTEGEEKPEKGDKAVKVEKTEKQEKQKPEKVEKTEKQEKQKAEKVEKTEKQEKPKAEKAEKTKK